MNVLRLSLLSHVRDNWIPFWRWPDGSARDAGIRTLALHFCDEGLPLSCERGSMSLGGQMFGLRVTILLPAFTFP